MRFGWQWLLTLAIGFGAGLAGGAATTADADQGRTAPRDLPPLAPAPPQVAAPAPVAAPVAVAEPGPAAAAPTPKVDGSLQLAEPPAPAAAPAGPVVPARAGLEGATQVDVHFIPRGPGRHAVLDLAAAGAKTLTIRQGVLQRSGAAAYRTFAANPKVGTLRGPRERVELLHLGFDAEARPTLAHIRTAGRAEGDVEGIVALKLGEVFVPVLPDPQAAVAAPAAATE